MVEKKTIKRKSSSKASNRSEHKVKDTKKSTHIVIKPHKKCILGKITKYIRVNCKKDFKKSVYVTNIKKIDKGILLSSLMDLLLLIITFAGLTMIDFFSKDMQEALLSGTIENYVGAISTVYSVLLGSYFLGIFIWSLSRGLVYKFTYNHKFSFNRVLVHFGITLALFFTLTLLFIGSTAIFVKNASAVVNFIILLVVFYCYIIFTSFIFAEKKVLKVFLKSVQFKGVLKIIGAIVLSYSVILFATSILNYFLTLLNYTNNFATDTVKSFIILILLLVGISWSRRYISDITIKQYEKIRIKSKR